MVMGRIKQFLILEIFVLCFCCCFCENDKPKPDLKKALESIKEAFKNFAKEFAEKIQSAADLATDNADELPGKLNDTLTFLKNVKEHAEDIKVAANEKTKEALTKLDGWIEDLEKTADQAKSDAEGTLGKWKNQAGAMYNSGLKDLIAFTQNLTSKGSPTLTLSAVALLFTLIPVYLSLSL